MLGEGIHFGLSHLSAIIVNDVSGVVLGVIWFSLKLKTSGSQT